MATGIGTRFDVDRGMGVVPWLPYLKTNAAGCQSFPWGLSVLAWGLGLKGAHSWCSFLTWKLVDQINHGDLIMIRVYDTYLQVDFFSGFWVFFDIVWKVRIHLFPSVSFCFLSNQPPETRSLGHHLGRSVQRLRLVAKDALQVGSFGETQHVAEKLMTYRISSYIGIGMYRVYRYIASLWRRENMFFFFFLNPKTVSQGREQLQWVCKLTPVQVRQRNVWKALWSIWCPSPVDDHLMRSRFLGKILGPTLPYPYPTPTLPWFVTNFPLRFLWHFPSRVDSFTSFAAAFFFFNGLAGSKDITNDKESHITQARRQVSIRRHFSEEAEDVKLFQP